ncbi:MAG TPA: hypothetical protein VFC24_14020 [Casimicrobiaceae bacterium]|nr:hypothetical protein [Casimicrobiaceae bacterium]
MKKTLLALAIFATTLGSAFAAAPEGLYVMTRYWPGSGLEIAAYGFHDGNVVVNPVSSGRTLDFAAERAAHPKEVGTYKIQGNQMIMVVNGSTHQSKMEPESTGCFGWDAGIFCPVQPFKSGTTLEGTYEGGASVGGGQVMSSTGITFNRDGTYSRESVGSASTHTADGKLSAGSIGSERGKYRIEGTALHMFPDGGKERVISTFPFDDGTKGPAPRRIYFSGAMLKRVR